MQHVSPGQLQSAEWLIKIIFIGIKNITNKKLFVFVFLLLMIKQNKYTHCIYHNTRSIFSNSRSRDRQLKTDRWLKEPQLLELLSSDNLQLHMKMHYSTIFCIILLTIQIAVATQCYATNFEVNPN